MSSDETSIPTLTAAEIDELRAAGVEYPWKSRDLLRLARESKLLRAEVTESYLHCEPTESVRYVLRNFDEIDYPETECMKCKSISHLAFPGEKCLVSVTAGNNYTMAECDGILKPVGE